MKRPDEAMAQIQRAIEPDPLNPSFRSLYCNCPRDGSPL